MGKALKWTSYSVAVLIVIIVIVYATWYAMQDKAKEDEEHEQHLLLESHKQQLTEIESPHAEILNGRMMRVSWEDIPYATSFEIYIGRTMAVSPEAYEQKFIAQSNPAMIHLEGTFDPSEGVYYTIVARRALDNGEIITSEMSHAQSAVAMCKVLAAPRIDFNSVYGRDYAENTTFLAWEQVPGAHGYTIYFGDYDVSPSNFTRRTGVPASNYWYIFEPHATDKALVVTARDECGESEPSRQFVI